MSFLRNTRSGWLIALVMTLGAIVIGSLGVSTARAGTVSGTFSVSWAGATAPVGYTPEPAASADWSFAFHTPAATPGSYPSLLTNVKQSFTTPCDPAADMGVTTTTVSTITDAAATMSYAPFLDLRRHKGTVALRPSQYENGIATRVADRLCSPPLDGSNGRTSEDIPVFTLFDVVNTPKNLALTQSSDGSWNGAGTQTVSPGDAPAGFSPQVQTMKIKMMGTATSLSAQCRMPTPNDLRRVRTLRQAKAYLRSAGFSRPNFFVLPSHQIRKGRYFITQQVAGNTFRNCGSGLVTLVRSSGRPSGSGGG
ncbi:MAG: hypothetical protein H7123_00980 [Thermoleophilia bacterium]|nr:hypothetical protein [Thermoleophilia bacterium]